jgi:rhodanese-related sulfurtransferase
MHTTTSRERTGGLPYKADISCKQAWALLKENTDARLVDVRTHQEWQQVGVPDLAALGKEPLLLEWMSLPACALNPDFKSEISAKVPAKDTPLLFMCKAGGRSMQAAAAMASAGYGACYNVAGGFEGAGNQSDITTGWMAAELPWRLKA